METSGPARVGETTACFAISLVGATFQCGPLVGIGFLAAVIPRPGAGTGRTAQPGPVGIFTLGFATVVKHFQASPHVVEFRRIDQIFGPGHQDVLNLSLRCLDAIVRHRVRREHLGDGAWLFLFQGLVIVDRPCFS